MINILNMESFCGSLVFYNVLNIIKKSLGLIQLFGPILGIIALIISFTRLTINPDQEETYKKRIKNTLIAIMILFLMPSIINLIMSLPSIEDNTTIGGCWSKLK
ncbi:MAG: hypothetical protein IJF92_02100 [Bacilli bacterium]|nr:hypothetical protein [Bacilli bacterium]